MTLPPKSRACFVAASNLGPEDTARFLELHEQYTKAGASPTEAAKTAAADLVAEIEQEAKDLGTIIGPVAPKAGRVEQVWDVVRNFDHAKARDAFLDAVTSHGGTSVWNPIQTQYAKAQKNPTTFKPVFDAVQDFLKDVSTFANDAADRAPDILPKLQSRADVLRRTDLPEWLGGKSKEHRADVDAAGAALWRGTLDNVLYDDADLARLGLNQRQREIYHQARDAIDKSLDDMVKSELVRLSRSEAGSVARHAAAMPTAAAAADFLTQFVTERDPESTLPGLLADKIAQLDKLKRQGYAPLMRFGKHTVLVQDDKGKTLYFSMHESAAAAGERMRALQSDPEFEGATFTQGKMSDQAFQLFKGFDTDALELFADATGNADNEVYQEFLKLTKSNRSALKRLIHREGIAGYSEDLPRVMASFITSNARLASGNMHMSDAKVAAEAIPNALGDLKDEAVKLIDYVQNPQEEAGLMRGLLFTTYIGGSVASALVNLTQPFTMSLPYLSQFGGAAKAAKHLMSAAASVAAGKIDPESDVGKALHRAEANGIVSPQEIHHLQAEVRGGGNPLLRKASFVWGSMFSLAEQFNRRATFVAAWNAAIQNHNPDPQGFAERAVIETQGLYNKGNKPNWARGPIGATVMTFKQFSIHYLEFLGRMWDSGPEGKKAVGLAIALLMLTAGAGGLPFADDLDDLIDTFAQNVMGLDFSSKRAKREFLASTLGLGEFGADLGTRGLSAVWGLPLDVSMRMSMGNLIPGTGMFLRSNTDKTKDVMEFGGAAGSFAKAAATSISAALRGDFGAAATGVTPLAVQNIIKSVEMWNTGEYRDTHGNVVIHTDEADAAAKFLGFQPREVAKASAIQGDIARSEQLAKNVRAEIAQKWEQGLRDNRPELVTEARDMLRQWNEDNPEAGLRIQMQSIINAVRKSMQDRAQRLVKNAPAGMRPYVREQLNP